LAHLIVNHLGVKHAKGAPPPKSRPAAPRPAPPHLAAHPVAAKPPLVVKPAPKTIHVVTPALKAHVAAKAKPPGLAHAAVHKVTLARVNTAVQHV
jgi:hypothetical protein